ncbi:hypothetical protein BKA61DRAFT_682503 [Leptodontidium sp. MPI-SDFR-AT-0119]|nr:hypothetical protein BKA61DRAFT_682503 [Leptodontidium sp. MPI-SDFR-AT-0119]
MSEFEKRYLTIANKPDAPESTFDFVSEIHRTLICNAPELESIAYPLLASMAVGCRRPDMVPLLFNAAICNLTEDDQIAHIFQAFSGAIITVWPSVGAPWCNPAMMSLANILRQRNFRLVEKLSIRPPIGPADIEAGNKLLNERYTATKDPTVQDLLSTYCRDFDNLTRAVALGYCHVGTTSSGIFEEHQTELILAAALASAGATRSATVHGKTALALGNSLDGVKAVYMIAVDLNQWNHTPCTPVDVVKLSAELKAL